MPKAVLDIRSLARAQTAQAVRVLTGVMNQKSAPPAARVVAANSLLDRGWGRAASHASDVDDGDVKVYIRQLIVNTGQSPEPVVIEHDPATGHTSE